MVRVVIISGGRIADYEYICSFVHEGDVIICADSGYDHAVKMGFAPHVVVGDFDSIGEIPQGVEKVCYPAEKDMTDTEIAIEYAVNKGFDDFLILGATGARLDHGLANILMLKALIDAGKRAVIVDEHNKIMMTSSSLSIKEPKGSIVSLIPIENCTGVTTQGLKYSLTDAKLIIGKSVGVSNVMVANEACVSIKSGLLVVIVARD